MKAFVFPGQGSQKVGMGAGLFDHYKEHVDNASDILGYCLKTLCLEDPKSELKQTQFTQPALYVVSALMYLDVLDKGTMKPSVLAGHSLGEYNALFAAGAFTFEAGLELVKKRAELMGRSNGGSMAAVIGSTLEEIEKLLSEKAFQGLDVASVNSSKQIVLSGPPELIFKLATHFEPLTAQCHPLNVSAAFHSRYMKPAADDFLRHIENFSFSPLQIPVISNAFARPYDEAQSAQILASQIYSPVKWEKSIQYMMAMGVDTFSEVGPGSVLTNMQKNISVDPLLELQSNELANIELSLNGYNRKAMEGVGSVIKQAALNDAFDVVSDWNSCYLIGAKVKFKKTGEIYKTTSKAMVLFHRKAVIYLEHQSGFFSLSEVDPLG